jgi:hypothetical protein
VPPLMPKESALFKVQQEAWGERSRQPVFSAVPFFERPTDEDASLPGSIPRDTRTTSRLLQRTCGEQSQKGKSPQNFAVNRLHITS